MNKNGSYTNKNYEVYSLYMDYIFLNFVRLFLNLDLYRIFEIDFVNHEMNFSSVKVERLLIDCQALQSRNRDVESPQS